MRSRSLPAFAALVALVAAALLPVGAAEAVTPSITATPSSTTVGTRVTITSSCTTSPAPGVWLAPRVSLYFPDAFTDMYEQRSAFTSVTGSISTDGSVVATITVPATGTYTKAGTGPMPGPDVTRAVSGRLGVDVVCFGSLSAFPWQVVTRADALTVSTPALAVRAKPAISGTRKKGATLTASTGSFSPAATSYSFQWKRNGKAIAKATKKTYKVKTADKGKKLTVAVTAKRAGYKPTTTVSKPVRIKA
ncbi:MAG: hypothetical protein U0S36_15100 [Candidatus Nanopelagicales bacterium]